MTSPPPSVDVTTPVLPLCQPPRRPLRASSTKASARSDASASSFKSGAADLVVRAPISPSAIRVRHRDHHAGFRRRHHARAAALPTTAPAQSEPTRRPRERRRAASESSTLIAPPTPPSVRRSPSAPRACDRSRRAERAGAPLELSLLLLLTSPRRLNQSQHDDRESAAEPRASRRP